jgi:hypothetical protein
MLLRGFPKNARQGKGAVRHIVSRSIRQTW